MREHHRVSLKALFLGCCAIAVGLTAFVLVSPPANYIWRAYFYPGSSSNLRGYPTVDPPSCAYTGSWTHYAFTGRPLAIDNYIDGDTIGKQVYLKDDGSPYLVRYLNHQGWERDEVNLGPPPSVIIPWVFPQRWVNRSLDRLSFLDKVFFEPPAVIISEEPADQGNSPKRSK
jgi:hypothetical protein